MPRNEGSLDRIVRVTVGIAALLVVLIGTVAAPWNWILGVVGAVLVATGAVGFCPLYGLFRIRSGPKSS